MYGSLTEAENINLTKCILPSQKKTMVFVLCFSMQQKLHLSSEDGNK
jgi:hypothetical protein